MHQFLIIQTAFIGDVVLATGLVEKLHAHYPDAKIDFLLRKGNESLLAGHPFIREILIWNKKKDKQANLFRVLRKIRSKKYDTVINVQRFAATGILTAFSRSKETIGFDKNPFSFFFSRKIKHIVAGGDQSVHEISRNHSLIEHLTDPKPFKPRLYPSQSDYDKVAPYKKQPYITVSPSSVWFTKQYPQEKWISFLKGLPGGLKVFLLGGAADKQQADAMLKAYGTELVNLCGTLSFLESAALIRDAVMNYVNDSAPMHFASALNAPVAAVYCSTIPAFGFGPLSDKRYIIELKEPLYCRPCGLHGYRSCPEKHFRCAYDIRDAQLLEVLPG